MVRDRVKGIVAAGLVLLLTTGLLTGCGPAGVDKDTVALVNGVAIRQDVLDKNFLLIEKTYKEIYGETIMTEQIDGKSVRSIVLNETLENLVDDALIAQYLEKEGFKVDENEVDQRYQDFTANELDTKPDNKKFYEDNGIEKTFIRDAIRSQIYVGEFEKRINDDVLLKSTDLEAAFLSYVIQVQAQHILVDQEAKAKELYEKLQAGADFAALAKAESLDPGSAVKGGDLGFFKRGAMVSEFDSVAFTLKPGAFSEPVKTQFGYHIIRVGAQKTAQDMLDEGATAEQMKPEKDAMIRNMINAQIAEKKKALREAAEIQLFKDKLK